MVSSRKRMIAALVAEHAPALTEIVSFNMTARFLTATAAGRWIEEISVPFSHEGQDYRIVACFTHTNGFVLRFSANSAALAFIAAGFTVDTGISDAPIFSSSIMGNPQNSAEYRAFEQKFVVGTSYTITIYE